MWYSLSNYSFSSWVFALSSSSVVHSKESTVAESSISMILTGQILYILRCYQDKNANSGLLLSVEADVLSLSYFSSSDLVSSSSVSNPSVSWNSAVVLSKDDKGWDLASKDDSSNSLFEC